MSGQAVALKQSARPEMKCRSVRSWHARGGPPYGNPLVSGKNHPPPGGLPQPNPDKGLLIIPLQTVMKGAQHEWTFMPRMQPCLEISRQS